MSRTLATLACAGAMSGAMCGAYHHVCPPLLECCVYVHETAMTAFTAPPKTQPSLVLKTA